MFPNCFKFHQMPNHYAIGRIMLISKVEIHSSDFGRSEKLKSNFLRWTMKNWRSFILIRTTTEYLRYFRAFPNLLSIHNFITFQQCHAFTWLHRQPPHSVNIFQLLHLVFLSLHSFLHLWQLKSQKTRMHQKTPEVPMANGIKI